MPFYPYIYSSFLQQEKILVLVGNCLFFSQQIILKFSSNDEEKDYIYEVGNKESCQIN